MNDVGWQRHYWSGAEPGLVIFIIDQSGSTSAVFGNETKSIFIKNYINDEIRNLILSFSYGDEVKNRCYLSVVNHCNGNAQIKLQGFISEISENPLRIENELRRGSDGNGGMIEFLCEIPYFIEPQMHGESGLSKAFRIAKEIVLNWNLKKSCCPAPIIVNISGGVIDNVTDLLTLTNEITKIKNDRLKEPLIFNILLSDLSKISFPSNIKDLYDDEVAKIFYNVSSDINKVISECYWDSFKPPIELGSRALLVDNGKYYPINYNFLKNFIFNGSSY